MLQGTKRQCFHSWELYQQAKIRFPQIHWEPGSFPQNMAINEMQVIADSFLTEKGQKHPWKY